MTPVNQSRKAALLKATNLIRPIFRSRGYNLEPYSNNAIADALLATCPQMDESWLSSKYLRLTFHHLSVDNRHGICVQSCVASNS